MKQNQANKMIGYIIRKERLQQNISLRCFATYAGISKTYLSDIELGKIHIDNYYLKKIEDELDIFIDTSQKKLQVFKAKETSFFIHYVYNDTQFIIDQFNNLTTQEATYLHAIVFPQYLLMKLFYFICSNENHHKIPTLLSQIQDIYDFLETNEKTHFLILSGYYDLKNNHTSFAEEKFILVKEKIEDSNLCIKAIFYSYLSLYYYFINQNEDALYYLEKANVYCIDLCAYKRIAMNTIHKTNIYISQSKYNDSYILLKKMIEYAQLDSFYYPFLYASIAYCLLKESHHKESLTYIVLISENDSLSFLIFIFHLYVYLGTDNISACLAYLEKIDFNSLLSLTNYHMAIAIKSFLTNDIENTIIHLDSVIKHIHTIKQPRYLNLYLEIVIDTYKKIGCHDKAIKTLEYKLNQSE